LNAFKTPGSVSLACTDKYQQNAAQKFQILDMIFQAELNFLNAAAFILLLCLAVQRRSRDVAKDMKTLSKPQNQVHA
jgi:hypothetical protein